MKQTSSIKNLSQKDIELQKEMLNKISSRIKLLNFISNGIEIYGIDKFKSEINQLKLLKHIDGTMMEREDMENLFNIEDRKYISKVISVCESEFCKINKNVKVTFDDVLKKERRKEATDLRRLIVYSIIKNTNTSVVKLAIYLNRTRQVVFQLLRESEEMLRNPELLKNKQFIQIYNKVKK